MGTHLTLTASDDHKFDAYRVDPAGTPKGGIVVIQELFGVNRHIRSVADRFAALGYVAIAPALFDRIEAGFESGYSPEEVQAARRFVANPPMQAWIAKTNQSSLGSSGTVTQCSEPAFRLSLPSPNFRVSEE
jgi:carboxymethylenebutenolidase